MKKAKVTLELTLTEYKIIESSLKNYKGKMINDIKRNDGNFEQYSKLCGEERQLDSLMDLLSIERY